MMLFALISLVDAAPSVGVASPALQLHAKCSMQTHDRKRFKLDAGLLPVAGKGHRWTLKSSDRAFPTNDDLGLIGLKIDTRTYQFLLVKDRSQFRYKLVLEYTGFIPGEPRTRNAIMTVSQSQPNDTSLLLAAGICDVVTGEIAGA